MGHFEANNLTKKLGDNLVVDDVSFSVEDGEFFVIVGPSGSGKSTLLRLVCGLEKPDSGSIVLAGRDITSLPPRERNLGMVFQDYGLYPNMNVWQNIAYGLEARGVKRQVIDQLIPAAAEKLGLTELLKRNIVDLSGGEQQRVALARAMVKDADAYLYDEPLSNLDPKLRHKARRDILVVHEAKARPSIYVTHDQSEAFAMGDRILVLAQGRTQQIGTTEELIGRPANTFVASFVGSPSTNLLEGQITTRDGQFMFSKADIGLPLPDRWKPILDAYNRESVILGIRPDAIVRTDAMADFEIGPHNTLNGTIEFVESLLGETIVGVNVGKTSITALLEVDATELNENEPIALAVDLDRVSLFDSTTETNLDPAIQMDDARRR